MLSRTVMSCVLCSIFLHFGLLSAGDDSAPAPKTITNSIGMKLVLIPAGEFLMGSPDSDQKASDDQKPQHKVQITKPFYLGATEVTQTQYQEVIGDNPSWDESAGDLPVDGVWWSRAVRFCRILSDRDGRSYRLPTEAEWEYACRAGSTTMWFFGEDESKLREYAWFYENSGAKRHPVAQKKPNAWGLYDMYGNVREWCHDWYGKYQRGRSVDPLGPPTPEVDFSRRVIRGGDAGMSGVLSWGSAYRDGGIPVPLLGPFGFRVACDHPGASQ